MRFFFEDFTLQILSIKLITEIKDYRTALKKAKNIIINSIILKYQATFKRKLVKKI